MEAYDRNLFTMSFGNSEVNVRYDVDKVRAALFDELDSIAKRSKVVAHPAVRVVDCITKF